ncbi:IS3 family transposase [Pediococcus acidilactici]|uniref:IS3 family transposase n=3 Tax=Pediococcus acidilactici TaxID=1254 RepID=UPI001320FBC7|nr:IS3 family transposase [Pediococcus acidilactici]KAF0468979.1 IS3 family transposase [Pediococcus acidilactici]KAF0540740.1 IS3 family transposase [Pediococcus acidilactici]
MSSITYSERIKIETFCELSLSNIQMSDRLKRSPATISYELARCEPYQAEVAQTDAEYKRSRCGRKTKLNDKLRQIILNHLRLSWSPEMIAHEFKLATKSIYNWLNQGKIEFSLNDLPEHGVRQRRNLDQRSKYNQSLGRSIEQRPIVVNRRNRIGDFELDTSVGYDKMTRLINLSQQISYNVNKKRIIRIMKEHGIKADYRQPTRKRIQTQQAYEAENILKRQFNQTAANQVWVTDTTEITYGVRLNKVRLHVVLDLYGQYPVIWLITPTETAEGAIKAFEKARVNEGALAPLIHTDRGAAYTSKAFNQYLVINNAQHSYSAPGTPADNAVIEHWWADFKAIWIAHLPKAQTLVELKQQVKEGITYFTEKFISAKRNDLTAAEYRFGKAN